MLVTSATRRWILDEADEMTGWSRWHQEDRLDLGIVPLVVAAIWNSYSKSGRPKPADDEFGVVLRGERHKEVLERRTVTLARYAVGRHHGVDIGSTYGGPLGEAR
jgi:hypothetical protein